MTIIPVESEGFCLNKREFVDALCLRYRWTPKYLPINCACGLRFDVDHALSCPKGGFIHQRHDEMRNLLASLLSQVHTDVSIEPQLQPLTGETIPNSSNKTDEARLDVSARSFWQRGQLAFFDVRITNPFAKSHLNQNLQSTFRSSELEKKTEVQPLSHHSRAWFFQPIRYVSLRRSRKRNGNDHHDSCKEALGQKGH